jgi:hypothetical protein
LKSQTLTIDFILRKALMGGVLGKMIEGGLEETLY